MHYIEYNCVNTLKCDIGVKDETLNSDFGIANEIIFYLKILIRYSLN